MRQNNYTVTVHHDDHYQLTPFYCYTIEEARYYALSFENEADMTKIYDYQEYDDSLDTRLLEPIETYIRDKDDFWIRQK